MIRIRDRATYLTWIRSIVDRFGSKKALLPAGLTMVRRERHVAEKDGGMASFFVASIRWEMRGLGRDKTRSLYCDFIRLLFVSSTHFNRSPCRPFRLIIGQLSEKEERSQFEKTTLCLPRLRQRS